MSNEVSDKEALVPGRQSPTPVSEGRSQWHTPQPEILPKPTYWPAVMALGIVFLLWGMVTTFVISGAGLTLFALALAGWIGELRREHHHDYPTAK